MPWFVQPKKKIPPSPLMDVVIPTKTKTTPGWAAAYPSDQSIDIHYRLATDSLFTNASSRTNIIMKLTVQKHKVPDNFVICLSVSNFILIVFFNVTKLIAIILLPVN